MLHISLVQPSIKGLSKYILITDLANITGCKKILNHYIGIIWQEGESSVCNVNIHTYTYIYKYSC